MSSIDSALGRLSDATIVGVLVGVGEGEDGRGGLVMTLASCRLPGSWAGLVASSEEEGGKKPTWTRSGLECTTSKFPPGPTFDPRKPGLEASGVLMGRVMWRGMAATGSFARPCWFGSFGKTDLSASECHSPQPSTMTWS